MTLSIAIAGAAGRMGRALIRAASADDRFRIVGGAVRPDSSSVGADIGSLAGGQALGVAATDDVRSASSGADVWIDFTSPAPTLAALTLSRARAAVVGATGFSPEEDAAISAVAQRLPIVRSGNFSLGVNLLAALVEQAAQRLGPEWDIEITEAHHRRKADAPSGTALLLGQAAAHGRGVSGVDAFVTSRATTGPRKEGSIGFSVIRGGGIVGEHDVRFIAEREVLTLSHLALDRAVFADGALAAALWIADKPPGLYSMRDVLGL